MNLLLSDQPEICANFVERLGVATLLVSVEPNDEFSFVAVNQMAVDFYNANERPSGLRIKFEDLQNIVSDRPDFEPYLERALNNFRKVKESAEQLVTETDFIDRLGVIRWSQNFFTPLMRDQKVARILVSLRDITELKIEQKALEHSLSILANSVAAICDSCDKVRIEDGNWVTMNQYLNEHTSKPMSHSICNACSSRFSA